MPLTQELPEFRFVPRGTRSGAVWINQSELTTSFIVSTDTLIENWRHGAELVATDLDPVLALNPEIVLLGTGERLRFPAQEVLAACLTRGVGIEVMDNRACARTFVVLASEGRRVAAAFMLPGDRPRAQA